MNVDSNQVEKALIAYFISNPVPEDLATLSSHTDIEGVSDVSVDEMRKHELGHHVRGNGQISVRLDYGGGESRDGMTTHDTFPFQFVAVISDSGEIESIERLEFDTTSFCGESEAE